MRDLWVAYKTNFSRHSVTQLTSLVTLCLSFTILFSSFVFIHNVDVIFSGWGDELQFSVYLKESATAAEIKSVAKSIKEIGSIKSLQFVSGEEALKEFREDMGRIAPDVAEDPEFQSSFPSSYVVSVDSKILQNSTFQIYKTKTLELQNLPHISEVSWGQNWMENFSAVFRSVRSFFLLVGIAVLLGVMFVTSNSIRASIAERRKEIEVLELIGATAGDIRRPYLFEGLFNSLMSVSTAVMLVGLGFLVVKYSISNEIQFFRVAKSLELPSIWFMSLFIIGSTLFGLFASYTVVRTINNGWASIGETE